MPRAGWHAFAASNQVRSLSNSFHFRDLCRANKMSIVSGDKIFYYMTRESLCFLTMTEAKYPKRMAFLYLDEVCDLVLQELVKDHGNSVSLIVQCIDNGMLRHKKNT